MGILRTLANKLNPFAGIECLKQVIGGFKRRQGWVFRGITFRKALNLATLACECLFKRSRLRAWPALIKIDISPLCNLRCVACVHAIPNGDPCLEKQRFRNDQLMPVNRYRLIIDEIKKNTSAVSLYYLGDPLMHPNLAEMCHIASQAGLGVHITTNFSFTLSDEKLNALIDSGLTHLAVCVDGLTQESYAKTRVGGRIDVILSNLERMVTLRNSKGAKLPHIEVQYIKYQHNVHELEPARRLLSEIGVDSFFDFWGRLENFIEWDPERHTIMSPKRTAWLPRCLWTHLSMTIKYDGDVLPCCMYRHGQQYTDDDDCHAVGNVFESSVREAWNSPGFVAARRLACRPSRINKDPALKNSFCYGCHMLYNLSQKRPNRKSDDYRYDDYFELNDAGRPVRRHESHETAS